MTAGHEQRSAWYPPWVNSLGMPVWISGPDRNISYLNEKAETLIGRPARECIGLPCHQVIAGVDGRGRLYCGPSCPALSRARDQQSIEPVQMRITDAGRNLRWIQVLTIPVTAPDLTGPWMVHCALGADRAHRLETYLNKVASRTARAGIRSRQDFQLTRRENEILQLLAEDENLYEIAHRLHVSYVTVRNHVQHILAKLGVHSTIEAVACYLLVKD